MNVYILYQITKDGEWHFQGVFGTKEKAEDRVNQSLHAWLNDETLHCDLRSDGGWEDNSRLIVIDVNPMNFPEPSQHWYRYQIQEWEVQ